MKACAHFLLWTRINKLLWCRLGWKGACFATIIFTTGRPPHSIRPPKALKNRKRCVTTPLGAIKKLAENLFCWQCDSSKSCWNFFCKPKSPFYTLTSTNFCVGAGVFICTIFVPIFGSIFWLVKAKNLDPFFSKTFRWSSCAHTLISTRQCLNKHFCPINSFVRSNIRFSSGQTEF